MGSEQDKLGQLAYSLPWSEERDAIVKHVLFWGQGDRKSPLNLSGFESCIGIKNIHRHFVYENPWLRELISGSESLVGKTAHSELDPKTRKLSQTSDDLIIDGVSSLEIDHLGSFRGKTWSFLTYKRRLDELKDSDYAILLITRPIALLGQSEPDHQRSLNDLLILLNQLDEVDRTICLGCGNGDSAKDIAAQVGMTTRSVELRRQKMLEVFGFSRPIEIAKMLVRLEERGLI
jgi:hypothetical protein